MTITSVRNISNTSERKIHVYGIGLIKTGTVTLTNLLGYNFVAQHEQKHGPMWTYFNNCTSNQSMTIDWMEPKCPKLERHIRWHDRNLTLEADVSYSNAFVSGRQARAFKDAKFIMTLRDPWTWLMSVYEWSSRKKEFDNFHQWFVDMYGPSPGIKQFPDEEQGLARLNQGGRWWPLRKWLHLWKTALFHALNHIPKHRLLIVHTSTMGDNATLKEIADFIGQDVSLITPPNTSKGENHASDGEIFSTISPKYLDHLIYSEIGKHTMDKFFPHIKSYEQAMARFNNQIAVDPVRLHLQWNATLNKSIMVATSVKVEKGRAVVPLLHG